MLKFKKLTEAYSSVMAIVISWLLMPGDMSITHATAHQRGIANTTKCGLCTYPQVRHQTCALPTIILLSAALEEALHSAH